MDVRAPAPALPPVGQAAVIDDFGHSLGVLLRAYHAMAASVLEPVPHGARGYQTLAAVARGDQPSQLALATCLGIDRTVMTYLIDDLVAAGLVERQLNPADRRQRKIVTTPRGVSLLADLERQVGEAEDRLLGGLAPAGRAEFRRLLRLAACAVGDSPQPSPDCTG
jgi:DNA-binding MarR family transcriptional regulator